MCFFMIYMQTQHEIMTARFLKKYSFWLKNLVKNKLNIILINRWSSSTIYISFHAFYLISWQRSFTLYGWFFDYYFIKILWINEKIPFWITKRGQNSKIISLFESLELDYITILPLLFTWIRFGTIYSQKRIFLYCFMHKRWKITKYRFGLQKGVKIQK